MTVPADPLVSGLIADAKLVAAYGRYGVFKDNSLFVAIGNAEHVGNTAADQTAVADLQKALNDCSSVVPFTTLVALRDGWSPGDMSFKTRMATYVMVLVSIVLMIVTATLTYQYNVGTALRSELDQLDNTDFAGRFSQSVRQVWATQKQLQKALSNGTSTTDFSLMKDSYYQAQDSLHSLNQKFVELWANSQRFINEDAKFPLWGMKDVYCGLFASKESDKKPTANSDFYNTDQENTDRICAVGISSTQQAPPVESNDPPTDVASDDVNYDYKEATRFLQQAGVITLTPESIPAMTAQIRGISSVLSPYALWILPALYGAMGAIMFQMRMILNPLLPNPPLARLIHRIALGALAGMVLAWFFAPGTKLGDEVSGIGFSLFTFAFLFGFSLDIFFTTLDQFVGMSVAGIKKFGSSTVA
ncbi:hypothetical protein FJ987_12400 [Mesorhizobium sp. CU2]|uniref:hypothetical protein n=1 Tax=unclassified Mesorhizobium TaxID=325217 RepID=UPI00112A6CB7|nr:MULTISPECIES: hypothetical protein [unclassified Mesorhizobium]TPN82502.1 hypothetical protein FJ988_15170 [Mesorhizobium sp. CU3]TPO15547.1 hypothetical protein FJ987_12400 [Mesorhizobium sp. CU2]